MSPSPITSRVALEPPRGNYKQSWAWAHHPETNRVPLRHHSVLMTSQGTSLTAASPVSMGFTALHSIWICPGKCCQEWGL